MKSRFTYIGVLVALTVIICWLVNLCLILNWTINWKNPLTYVAVFFQMHLFTGLFITGHDAMHGTISKHKNVNNFFGYLVAFLYAGFNYKRIYVKHHQHHKFVHTDQDPDFAPHSFWRWYLSFMLNYVSILQFVIMAIAFNVLKIWFNEVNLLLFWVLPSLLSTFQLFYFGTYVPHKGTHDNIHQSSTQKKNHFLAFISCYFFGYHLEHHQSPNVPWWYLYKSKI